MNLKSSTKTDVNMTELVVEIDAESFEKAVEAAYQRQKKNISMPGFRKGKVPRNMIEKMYGPAIFYEDAANELIPDAYEKALDECEEDLDAQAEKIERFFDRYLGKHVEPKVMEAVFRENTPAAFEKLLVDKTDNRQVSGV